MDKMYKNYVAEIKANKDDDTITALVSTDTVDRMGEVLDPKGANLTNFKKNPVVLFGHDYTSPPIGKALWIKKTPEGVAAKVKFADTQFAQEIKSLFDGGFMNAFSVGFIPDMDKVEEHDTKGNKKKASRTFLEWELLEFSAVPVPANPDALQLAMKKGLTVSDSTKKALELGAIDEATINHPNVPQPATTTDPSAELMAQIKELQDRCNAQEKEINNLKYQEYLKVNEEPKEKTLSEMTVGEVQDIIKNIANGVIRKAQGKVD